VHLQVDFLSETMNGRSRQRQDRRGVPEDVLQKVRALGPPGALDAGAAAAHGRPDPARGSVAPCQRRPKLDPVDGWKWTSPLVAVDREVACGNIPHFSAVTLELAADHEARHR
jgi:hypothetical protein